MVVVNAEEAVSAMGRVVEGLRHMFTVLFTVLLIGVDEVEHTERIKLPGGLEVLTIMSGDSRTTPHSITYT